MARTVTVQDLVTQVRQRADIERSQICTDVEIIQYLDKAYSEFYDLIVSRFENYYLNSVDLVSSGSNELTLPADFYKLVGVDEGNGTSERRTLKPFNFNERNKRGCPNEYRYQVRGSVLRILGGTGGVAPAGLTFTLWYIPAPVRVTLAAQILDGYAGWEEFCVLDAAATAVIKQELDPSLLINERERKRARILQMATDRDAGMPQRVTDVSELVGHPWDHFGGY